MHGCGGDDVQPAPLALFELPRTGAEEDFFALPWPTDLRRTPEGHIDVRGFPNPRGARSTLGAYIETISTRTDGWALNGAAYFELTAPVDPMTLPADAAASLADGASAFLIDVDPDSPTRGAKHPAIVVHQDDKTIYWPAAAVAIRPVYGVPLAAGRTYAAVITSALRANDGQAYERDEDFALLVDGGGDAAVDAARTMYEPAFAVIEEAGVARADVLALAVFTTQDPVSELVAIRDWMVAEYPVPTAPTTTWRWIETGDVLTRVEGVYGPVPNFQTGPSPYEEPGTGDIRMDESGTPIVAEEFDARFMLTIPVTPMPAEGYPIVLYAHGTGGDYESFVNDGTAEELASEGYAVMGIDQVLHGPRNPTTVGPELLFFNFLNPLAARDNNRQGALDVVQQARFAATVEVPTRIINTDPPVRFDPNRIYVFGHSQGGLNMPLFLAIDDTAKGGMLSGAGGTLAISVIEKTEPISIALAVQLFLVLPGSTPEDALTREAFSYEHPVLSLLQTWVEPSDTVNYAHMIFDSPREGFAPKSVLMTGGQTDPYTSANSNASLAAAMRVPIVEPVVAPNEALDVLGIAAVRPPVSADVAGGVATAGMLQFPDAGHFVAFQSDVAKAQIRGFFASFADGVPTIPAP